METTWKRCLKCNKNTMQTITDTIPKKVICPCGKSHYVAW